MSRERVEASAPFDDALALSGTEGIDEIARARADWCFSEGGPTGLTLGPSGAVYSTVCLLEGAVVYAVQGADQADAARAVDAFLERNGIHSGQGTVVDGLSDRDLLTGPALEGGGGRDLPGGGAGGAVSLSWEFGDADRLAVDGLPLADGFNRVSYDGTITEGTPEDVRQSGARYSLTVRLMWRYFSGAGDGELPR
ncbi:hypothetical protein GRS96_18015 [Rathayibacter sp. VKM Ac-2803]|uniref:hypothetical protein n=1 Tax=unclassified Rathayibacter TaxID=2609250 RepID=UPI00135931E5|nr:MULTISPECIES: hypothetical protein [unclassified Rathayibacter]MWV51168.1 hypothetical protein [Rathayibacter sp. VKM Ac-2803]MWV57653.1 hypothetical protein [Rathayibacter sp. VKM Ac-2754]